MGGQPLEARGMSKRRDTPDQIGAVDTTAGRSVTHQLDAVD